jgi:thiol-disulfide isomerase/thioredoxin
MTEPTLDIPRTNPVPIVLAAVVAVVGLVVLVAVFVSGGDSGDSGDGQQALDGPLVIDLGGETTAPTVVASGEPVPEVTFAYLDGGEGSFADYAGQPLVLNFFASWCAPCIEEMPDLEQVSTEYEGQVAFLGMATRDRVEAAESVVAQTGVTYPASLDPDGSVATDLRIMAMPGTVFIDADGRVQRVWLGRITADEVRQIIDLHLVS